MGDNSIYISTKDNIALMLKSGEFNYLSIEIDKDKIINQDVKYTTEILDTIIEHDPNGKVQLILSVKGYDNINLPLYSIKEVNKYLSSVFNASPVGVSRFEPDSLQVFLINESLEGTVDIDGDEANLSLNKSKLHEALLKVIEHLDSDEQVDAFMSNVQQALKG